MGSWAHDQASTIITLASADLRGNQIRTNLGKCSPDCCLASADTSCRWRPTERPTDRPTCEQFISSISNCRMLVRPFTIERISSSRCSSSRPAEQESSPFFRVFFCAFVAGVSRYLVATATAAAAAARQVACSKRCIKQQTEFSADVR